MSVIGNTIKGFCLALGYGVYGIAYGTVMFCKYLILFVVYATASLVFGPTQIRLAVDECKSSDLDCHAAECRHFGRGLATIFSLLGLLFSGVVLFAPLFLGGSIHGLSVTWLILISTNALSTFYEVGRWHSENKKLAEKVKQEQRPVIAPVPQPAEKSEFDRIWDKIQAVEFPTEGQARELSNEVLGLVADGKVNKADGLRLSKLIENARASAQ